MFVGTREKKSLHDSDRTFSQSFIQAIFARAYDSCNGSKGPPNIADSGIGCSHSLGYTVPLETKSNRETPCRYAASMTEF